MRQRSGYKPGLNVGWRRGGVGDVGEDVFRKKSCQEIRLYGMTIEEVRYGRRQGGGSDSRWGSTGGTSEAR